MKTIKFDDVAHVQSHCTVGESVCHQVAVARLGDEDVVVLMPPERMFQFMQEWPRSFVATRIESETYLSLAVPRRTFLQTVDNKPQVTNDVVYR